MKKKNSYVYATWNKIYWSCFNKFKKMYPEKDKDTIYRMAYFATRDIRDKQNVMKRFISGVA